MEYLKKTQPQYSNLKSDRILFQRLKGRTFKI